jgi:Raf kinase inhibitor-like YbhB/YbcL family protein
MQLTSPAFKAGESIPVDYTCDGKDVSPPLTWINAPANVGSFALVMEDPDAPAGTWIHWLIYNIPGDSRKLEAAIKKTDRGSDGAIQGASWGVDTFERKGYWGPCPPSGQSHRYVFTLVALDQALALPPSATKSDFSRAIAGHILRKAELTGIYERKSL